jgi:hypothetical protein
MKKLLIPLLVSSMFVHAEVTTSIGEYNFGPDTSEEVACEMAKTIAKQNAILNVVGESMGATIIESCENEKCDIQRNFISDQQGYIKKIIEEKNQVASSLGYKKCTSIIRADVEKIENPIKFKLDQHEFSYNEGDEVVISGTTNKQGLVLSFLYDDGVYYLLDGQIVASSPGKFMIPSTRENRLIAYLPQNKLQSKELLTVLFIEADDRRYDVKPKYNKSEMEDFLNMVPIQKRRVINEFVYIMKKGNTI